MNKWTVSFFAISIGVLSLALTCWFAVITFDVAWRCDRSRQEKQWMQAWKVCDDNRTAAMLALEDCVYRLNEERQ